MLLISEVLIPKEGRASHEMGPAPDKPIWLGLLSMHAMSGLSFTYAILKLCICAGVWSRPAALSFASAPLFQASRQRMQQRLQSNRQRFSAAHKRWQQHGRALKQRGLQHLQGYSQAQPSLTVQAATMRFIRRARQAYQFVPSIAMS